MLVKYIRLNNPGVLPGGKRQYKRVPLTPNGFVDVRFSLWLGGRDEVFNAMLKIHDLDGLNAAQKLWIRHIRVVWSHFALSRVASDYTPGKMMEAIRRQIGFSKKFWLDTYGICDMETLYAVAGMPDFEQHPPRSA